jgi:hypothetical protein
MTNPIVKRLEPFVGTWNIEIVLPTNPPTTVQAQAAFQWIEDGAFLLQRSQAERPDFPKGISIVGADDTNETYTMLYFDSRGVSRIYQMSVNDGVWKIWRNAPGFSQRFEGKFSADGKTITSRWEKSTDGTTWELDFNGTYRKV